MNYRLSLGYLNQNGVLDGTNTERLSLGLNYDQRFLDDRLDIRTNILGSRANNQYTPGGVLSNAAQMGPTQPVFDPTSTTGYYNWPGNTLQSADNPVEALKLATDIGHTYRSVGTIQGDYSVPWIEGLKAHVNLGYDVTTAERQTFNPSDIHSQLKAGTGGTVYQTTPSMTNTELDTYLEYNAPLNFVPGTIDLTGGYSYSQSDAQYPYTTATGLSTNLLGINGIPTALVLQSQQNVQDSRLISFFGRANYNYNDRYLAAFSIRRDGSSRFGPANAWGIFPSVALGLAHFAGRVHAAVQEPLGPQAARFVRQDGQPGVRQLPAVRELRGGRRAVAGAVRQWIRHDDPAERGGSQHQMGIHEFL